MKHPLRSMSTAAVAPALALADILILLPLTNLCFHLAALGTIAVSPM